MKKIFTILFYILGQVALARPTGEPATQPSLEFIENRGQLAAPVRYTAAMPGGGQLFAEADGLRFVLLEPNALAHGPQPSDAHQQPGPDHLVRSHAFDLRFLNASPAARLVASGLTAEHRNYFRGKDPSHWATDVRSYHELHYTELWPGVEARFYENAQQRLEYDFTLVPGADPAVVGVRHTGAEVMLEATGNLLITTTVGTMQELAPQAWQLDAAGTRQAVACHYELSKNGIVHFALGAYDKTRPLVIDPTVVFNTYTGSAATNWGFTATYDAQGNLYSGGIAFSTGYSTTLGAAQTRFGGYIDMALIKYDVTQKGPAARAWATYLGGTQAEFPQSMVVSSQGELLVLGSTNSNDFPVTAGAAQTGYGGGTPADPFGNNYYQLGNGSDMVVCRLSANGTVLRGSTYLGGSGNDGLLPVAGTSTAPQLAHNYVDAFRGDILIDAADNVYVASCTTSSNFPLGTGGFQRTYRGGTSDGVVCKLKGDLTKVLWGSYLGGSASDALYSLQLEPASGDLYVAGGTLSADLPATAGALNSTWAGNVDGFVARIAASGTSLVRTTYLGTSAYDQAYFVQLGSDGGVYVLGQTLGAYPTTAGLYRNTNGRQFIHKLDAALTRTQLATVFGSGRNSIDISPTAFLVDHCDRVYVCGWGGGANQNTYNSYYLDSNAGGGTNGLPVTAYAVQSRTDNSDFYLAQFTAGLTGLGYGTFFGGYDNTPNWGEHVDGGTSRFDPRGVIYQAVCTCGTGAGIPTLPGANYYSQTSGSGGNCNNAAFVLNFQPDIADVGPPQTVCINNPSPLQGTPNGGTWTGPGVSGSVASGFVFTPPGVDTYTLTYTVTAGLCTSSATRQVTAVSAPTVRITTPLQSAYCVAGTATLPLVPLVGTPAGGTFSGTGVVAASGAGQVFNPNVVVGSATITYTYNVGCAVQVTRQVEVVRANAGSDQTMCTTAAPLALVGTPAGGTWSGPGVSGSVASGFTFTAVPALAGVVSLTYTQQAADKSCAAISTRRITVVNAGSLTLTPLPTPLCISNTTRYPLVATPSGGYWYGPGVSTSATGEYYFTPSSAYVGTFSLTYSVGSGTVCFTQRTLPVTVSLTLPVAVPADTLLCPGTTRPVALRGGSPAGGTWAGTGVSGSAATGFVFTPPAGFAGQVNLVYTFTNGGCTGSAMRRVSVSAVPVFQPSWVPVACVEDRQAPLTVRFTDAAGNGATRWDFGDGSPIVNGADVQHTYRDAGHYQPQVSLRYLNAQCETTATLAAIEVQNQQIPNVITPNGDAANQTFRLPPSCAPHIELYTRWGQRVFEAVAYQNNWDASGQGAGLYYYLLTYPDGHRVKGWLEVIK